MKSNTFTLAIILFLSLLASSTGQARTKPAAAADYADKEAAWKEHQSLQSKSPYAGLKWRSVGPIVQGGRLVDMAVVPGQPYTFYAAYASGGCGKRPITGTALNPCLMTRPV